MINVNGITNCSTLILSECYYSFCSCKDWYEYKGVISSTVTIIAIRTLCRPSCPRSRTVLAFFAMIDDHVSIVCPRATMIDVGRYSSNPIEW